jgi:uncharacterized membrane protein
MYSKTAVLGIPTHVVLAAYPIAFYTTSAFAYLVFHFNGDTFWFNAGIAATVAGLVTAAIAAIPGVIDWVVSLPNASSSSRQRGLTHMLLNVAVVPFLIANTIIHWNKWDHPGMAGWGFFLALIALILALVGGYYGWRMAHRGQVESRAEEDPAVTPVS